MYIFHKCTYFKIVHFLGLYMWLQNPGWTLFTRCTTVQRTSLQVQYNAFYNMCRGINKILLGNPWIKTRDNPCCGIICNKWPLDGGQKTIHGNVSCRAGTTIDLLSLSSANLCTVCAYLVSVWYIISRRLDHDALIFTFGYFRVVIFKKQFFRVDRKIV